MPDAQAAADAALRAELIGRLQGLHALKAGALRMFDPMLAAVRAERDAEALPEVTDLLGNMLGAFGRHREVTAEHARLLQRRLGALGARPSRGKRAAVAERIGDEQTAELARTGRGEDQDMAATIDRNRTNVLSLSLAARGLPTRRT